MLGAGYSRGRFDDGDGGDDDVDPSGHEAVQADGRRVRPRLRAPTPPSHSRSDPEQEPRWHGERGRDGRRGD